LQLFNKKHTEQYTMDM